MAHIEFRRWWSLAWIIAVISGALLALDVVLRLMAGPAPAFLATQARVNPRKRERMLDAIAFAKDRLEQERRTGTAGPSRLCIIIGSSSAKVGLEESMLSDSLNHHFKVLNLSGNALGFQELDYFVQALTRSGFKADLLIMAIHPVFLVEARAITPRQSAKLAWGKKPLASLLGKGLPEPWFLSNLSGMHALFHNQFMEVRFAMLRGFGLPASALDPQEEASEPRTEYAAKGLYADPHLLELQMRHWEQIGAFDPGQYEHIEPETKVLRNLLHRTRLIAPSAAVLLMPEMSDFRRRVPSEATATLMRVAASADPSCSVLDLTKALPDQDFFDYQHVNKIGRMELSRKVGERLAEAGIASSN